MLLGVRVKEAASIVGVMSPAIYTASGMFHSLGLFAYRRRYLVIAAWIVVLCASLPLLPRLHSVLHGGGFANGTSEADRALALLQSDLRYYP